MRGENTWLDRIKIEYDNIRSALSWISKEEPEAGIQLAAALWRFWYLNGYLQEGRRWLEELLTRQPASTDDVIGAKAINRLAVTAVLQGDGATAQTLATQALSWPANREAVKQPPRSTRWRSSPVNNAISRRRERSSRRVLASVANREIAL